jgi:hypothetical protein
VDTAPVPVVLDASTDARFDPAVERAAYSFVVTAIEAAASNGAEELLVRLRAADGQLRATVAGATGVATTDLEHVTDRIGAVGGRLVMAEDSLVAELPLDSEW